MTPPNYEIVDCGAFCEVIFFYISPKKSAWGLFLQAQRLDQPPTLGGRLHPVVNPFL